MKKKTIILVTLALMLLGVNTNAQMSEKPRVIAMTDGEIDDQCSMIRFLLHANDMEVELLSKPIPFFNGVDGVMPDG